MDLADSSHLEFDYLRWMRIILRAARARRVIHVGGGACSLARALAAEDSDAARPGRQQVCEIDARVLALAREHFGLRRAPGLRVRVADGRRFVAGQAAESWDAVAIDAFIAATVPRHLITAQAFGEVARVAPLVLVNVLDDRAARELQLIAAGLSAAYPRVWALGGRTGNTILVGSTRRLDLGRIAAQAAADPSPARLTRPEAVVRLIGGTPALRDEDVVA